MVLYILFKTLFVARRSAEAKHGQGWQDIKIIVCLLVVSCHSGGVFLLSLLVRSRKLKREVLFFFVLTHGHTINPLGGSCRLVEGLGAILEGLGRLLAGSWRPSWRILGPSWAVLEAKSAV